MIKWLRNLFVRNTPILTKRITAVAEKDKSGRYRYFIYIDGKLAKEEIVISQSREYYS